MYEFKTEFVSSSIGKPNNFLLGKKAGAENVCTGKIVEPDRFMCMDDVSELAQNFLVVKALTAFAHNGVACVHVNIIKFIIGSL